MEVIAGQTGMQRYPGLYFVNWSAFSSGKMHPLRWSMCFLTCNVMVMDLIIVSNQPEIYFLKFLAAFLHHQMDSFLVLLQCVIDFNIVSQKHVFCVSFDSDNACVRLKYSLQQPADLRTNLFLLLIFSCSYDLLDAQLISNLKLFVKMPFLSILSASAYKSMATKCRKFLLSVKYIHAFHRSRQSLQHLFLLRE